MLTGSQLLFLVLAVAVSLLGRVVHIAAAVGNTLLYGLDGHSTDFNKLGMYTVVGHRWGRLCSSLGFPTCLGCSRPHLEINEINERYGLGAEYLSVDPPILLFSNFSTRDEGAEVIAAGAPEGRMQRATAGGLIRDDIRTNYKYVVRDPGELSKTQAAVLQSLVRRASLATNAPEAGVEPVQIQRTREGEFFKTHSDFDVPSLFNAAGPRTWTLLAYVQDVEAGGETLFPLLDLAVQPRRGTAVIWPNVYAGTLLKDMRTIHGSATVESGVKIAANVNLHNFAAPAPGSWVHWLQSCVAELVSWLEERDLAKQQQDIAASTGG